MLRYLKYSSILLLIFLLESCINNRQTQQFISEKKSVFSVQSFQNIPKPPSILSQSIGIVPHPPKLKTINWNASIQPLITQVLKIKNINQGSTLLVEPIINSTNGSLQTDSALNEIRNALENNETFVLISPKIIAKAKQMLHMSLEDSFTSRSKAIGFARYVGAKYLLYSNIFGDAKAPEIQILLMLVRTGEIIWSGNGVVQY